MKNFAHCTPSEFFAQTNKIRKSVSRWLTETDIMNIRRRMPTIPDGMSEEDRNKAMRRQAEENFNSILDAIFDEHPSETLELLALLCFVEPENVDDYETSEYLGAFAELINNENVINFFISLIRLENLHI